jgi:hypothetical protein
MSAAGKTRQSSLSDDRLAVLMANPQRRCDILCRLRKKQGHWGIRLQATGIGMIAGRNIRSGTNLRS